MMSDGITIQESRRGIAFVKQHVMDQSGGIGQDHGLVADDVTFLGQRRRSEHFTPLLRRHIVPYHDLSNKRVEKTNQL